MSSLVEAVAPTHREAATRQTVAIIGGGASGALLARALIRRTDHEVVLVAPDRAPGRGVAYGAAEPWHVLNARAGAMTADFDDPLDVVRWSAARGRPVQPGDFLPRAVYGDYLAERFAETVAESGGRLRHHLTTATALRSGPDGHVVLTGAGPVRADQVVLAVGNPLPGRLPGVSEAAYASPRFHPDPWAERRDLPADEPVLLLGTGLTAVDVALSLSAAGHRGQVEALSRRGLLPLAHPETPPAPVRLDLPDRLTLRQLLRRVRAEIAGGADWVAVVDELRHHADRLWHEFGDTDRQRFLRHVVRYWDVHRHRMAPPVAARIAELRERGALRFTAGRLRAVRPGPRGGLLVEVEGASARRFGAVICCTGPGTLPGAANPLLAGLFRDGAARPAPYGLGVDTDPDGRVVDARGHIRPGLWLAGPLRRGRSWEATAVPEIRAQINRLVSALQVRTGG
ncbi:FAD/NAD(P)-binding protein [Actinoplanes teichomyceticus]|uniref:Putative NAD(P)/FAD-binding protein YdhS n=1 Tax=Actinoplanes teichomyceticus TaxID=1867 RepID=A0A561VKQ0_ACTTI|nr:FAD/NAD(P)-binding protein [Actinoplanes teichomyceticus]TWG12205.1 putative NAD(P)/FAD-binding protein YdhS [Actinoplanes teichomyceticus]GIF14139.1 hydroxyacylglutathione hydrolase [Actinoplanes teichomyceticus]